jgi:hypothetical protein
MQPPEESVGKPSGVEPQKDPRKGLAAANVEARLVEIDGPEGPDPTRYGDWERKGRCIDF